MKGCKGKREWVWRKEAEKGAKERRDLRKRKRKEGRGNTQRKKEGKTEGISKGREGKEGKGGAKGRSSSERSPRPDVDSRNISWDCFLCLPHTYLFPRGFVVFVIVYILSVSLPYSLFSSFDFVFVLLFNFFFLPPFPSVHSLFVSLLSVGSALSFTFRVAL